jgi:hypothetical protein
MIRLVGVILCVCALLVGASATGSVLASSPIRPNQHFVGLVNGTHSGAVIYTVCPGPATGYGPPKGGQTVAARRVAAGGGDTGAGGRVIYARITPTTIVSLKAYGRNAPIPTSAKVPCQGKGIVTFSTCPLPQPCAGGARTDDVPVEFVDVAA